MSEFNIVITAIGAIVLLLGLVSSYVRRTWWLSDPLMALALGIILGPTALGVIDPMGWGLSQENLLEQAARLTLAIGLMGVALRIPIRFLRRGWRSLIVMLGLVMPLMWGISGLLVYGILDLPFWQAMLIGAVITPTDPIVATSIVTGVLAEEHLPERLRHFISLESGANDGLAYPFVVLCTLMLTRSSEDGLSHWLSQVILVEVVGAIVVGALMGYLAGQLLEWAERHKTIERQSFLGYSLALSITVLGLAKLIGTDGVLAVFVSGLAFDCVIGGEERSQEENVQEAINRFFILPVFILLGLVLPWQAWSEMGWERLLILGTTVLLLRRLPAVVLLQPCIRVIDNPTEAMFVGWFGPIGVAAILYSGYALRVTDVTVVWPVCSAMICLSILVHGLSAAPLTERLGRREQAATPE